MFKREICSSKYTIIATRHKLKRTKTSHCRNKNKIQTKLWGGPKDIHFNKPYRPAYCQFIWRLRESVLMWTMKCKQVLVSIKETKISTLMVQAVIKKSRSHKKIIDQTKHAHTSTLKTTEIYRVQKTKSVTINSSIITGWCIIWNTITNKPFSIR